SKKDGTDGKNFVDWPNGKPGSPEYKEKHTCSAAAKTFDHPGVERLSLPSGCGAVRIRAWGAGGGAGNYIENDKIILGGDGGGGAYVYTEGPVEYGKYDLIVVIGGAGGDGTPGHAGAPGFNSGGRGGVGTYSGAGSLGGGGGGGYSG